MQNVNPNAGLDSECFYPQCSGSPLDLHPSMTLSLKAILDLPPTPKPFHFVPQHL